MYKDLDLHLPFERYPPELALPRPILHRLIAGRTGHGDYAGWHHRFNHPPSRLYTAAAAAAPSGPPDTSYDAPGYRTLPPSWT